MIISNSTFKCNRRVARCQQNFKDSIVIPEIKENTQEYFNLLTEAETHIFKQLCILKQKYNIFRISQGILAKWCRVTREYVNKILKKFESVGILKMWYHHKAVSHYRLSSFFTNQVIASLSHLWRAIPLSFLLSQPALETTSQKSSQYIKGTKLLNTKYLVLSNFRSKERDTKLPSNTQFLKKETVMQADLTQLNFDYLKSIKPTLAGKIKLSAYPAEIVKQVDDQLYRMTKPITNTWAYLNQTCTVLCKQQGIEPNWSTMYKLSTQLGIPVAAPFYDSTFIPEKPVTSPVKKTGTNHGTYKTQETNWQLAKQRDDEWKVKDMASMAKIATQVEEDFKREDHQKWVEKGKMFREIMGLNELGEFVNGACPKEAIALLLGGNLANSKSDFQFAGISPKEVVAEHIDSLVDEDYDSDPFGDILRR